MAGNMIVSKEQTTLQLNTLQDIKTLAGLFIESGMFQDTKSVAQAVVKILAGQELGVGPFQAMESIDIIAGRVAISPLLLASIMKSQNKYNYKVIEHTTHKCSIAFYEFGKHIGTSTFTIEEAQKLGLSEKDNWRRQPQTMLFWRALAKGIRMFCPDLYGGLKVYTHEELNPSADFMSEEVPPDNTTNPTQPETNNPPQETPQLEVQYLDSLQKKKLLTLAMSKGFKKDEFEKLLQEKYGDKIPVTAYEEIMEHLKGVNNGPRLPE